MPTAFPEEFRRDVIAVLRKGEAPCVKSQRISESPKDVCIAGSSLPIVKTALPVTRQNPGDESAELRELKKLNRLLKQENDVLRRAAAYLSRDILPK